ncbi:hypothetical protein [Colwellia sp. 20A7]|uniref:hypothetical protein n=1 Tax=Colwellia sp. 20A7 TaxID=2689569 RepID=UPI001356EB17|nr:hypothetical protein [Colwellia sp. 20A7]
MLINTVLLFLNNALPVFIITSLLIRYFAINYLDIVKVKQLSFGVIVTVITSFILSSHLENLSLILDGKGTELFLSFGAIIVYLSTVCLFILSHKNDYTSVKKYLAILIFFIISVFNGAHFIIYLVSYWTQAQQDETVLIGITLGGGICLSISILFYFLLRYLDKRIYNQSSCYFLLFFGLGQLMQAIMFLQQVDIFSSSQSIWDSGEIIAEDSGLGQLLTVLFGYETTPSLLQLVSYAAALILPVMLLKLPYISLSFYGKKS